MSCVCCTSFPSPKMKQTLLTCFIFIMASLFLSPAYIKVSFCFTVFVVSLLKTFLNLEGVPNHIPALLGLSFFLMTLFCTKVLVFTIIQITHYFRKLSWHFADLKSNISLNELKTWSRHLKKKMPSGQLIYKEMFNFTH